MKKYKLIEKKVSFKSELVLSAKYHFLTKTLELLLKHRDDKRTSLYRYYEVPVQTFNNLLNSKSKGNYFNNHIRNKYIFNSWK